MGSAFFPAEPDSQRHAFVDCKQAYAMPERNAAVAIDAPGRTSGRIAIAREWVRTERVKSSLGFCAAACVRSQGTTALPKKKGEAQYACFFGHGEVMLPTFPTKGAPIMPK